jgi:sodium-dependent dicarboxylate transporter 2/3/5
MKKNIIILLGPLVCLLFQLGVWEFINPTADKVIGVALWMILWWITETVSISVTALIPLTFFPLLGIMSISEVSTYYGHPVVFLFFGGFIMALALEKVNLHKRIALNIIKATGTQPDRVVLGFLLATAFLSMWISNTATAVVMLPIAYSVIELLRNDADGFTDQDKNFALSLMLGIAYAANVGGIATIIGTPPNLVLAGFLESEYGYHISFVEWMVMGIPFTAVMLIFIYLILTKWKYPNQLGDIEKSDRIIAKEIANLGAMKMSEKIILGIFSIAIFLWIMKNSINQWIPGLDLSNTSIGLLAAFACFTITLKNELVFTWEDTKNLPWGIIILFGGGLALANGLSSAGIIDLIGSAVSDHIVFSVLILCAILIAILLFMTELMSNVALITIFAPMAAGVAIGLDVDVLQLLIPLTIASSCAFMLPMATPPNAIVFASGHIKVADMARTGIWLNMISILLLIVFFKYVVPFLFTPM